MAAFLVGAGLWKLLVFAAVALGIVAFLWGGSNSAHEKCLAHRFGQPGFMGSVACAVEH